MATKTSFFVKVLVGFGLCLGFAGGLAAQPTLTVTINGSLGPYISGSGEITNGGKFVSGITASGPSGLDYCLITYTGGATPGKAKVYFQGTGAGNNITVPASTIGTSGIVNPGSGYNYSSPPATATVANGSTGTNCTGSAILLPNSVKIDDSLGLNGTSFSAANTIDPVGVPYNASTNTYTNLPITFTAGIFQLTCNATVTVKVNDLTDGGNDTLSVSNCKFTAGDTAFTSKVAFPANTIPAPVPMAFNANILTTLLTTSEGTYTPGASSTFNGDATTLGISGTIGAVCSGCPTETLSPGTLSFSALVGGGAPTQTVTVNNSPLENESFAVTTSASWLTVSPAGGITGTTGAGGTFAVGVNTTGLAAGPYTGTVCVFSAASNSSAASACSSGATPTVTVTLTVTAPPPPVTITTPSLPNGEVGVAYSQTLAATGGTPPYSNWTVSSGSLPAGLSLNAASGTIGGTPTSAGTANFSVTVKDSAGSTSAAKPLSITIIAGVTITTASLPNGEVGVAYSQTLQAANGTPPYTWTLSSGSLPGGLTLNLSTGAITGNPTTVGTASFSVSVKDNAGDTAGPQSLSITVVAGPSITTTSLPGGEVGVAYSTTLAETGGTAPYTWTVSGGTLPGGLSLNSSSGVISGTPTTVGTPSFSVTVKDSDGITSPAANLSIAISGVTITTSSLPNGTVSAAYSTTLNASGGTAPYTWTLTTGSLPAGLTLNSSSGVIGGTPTTANTFSFSITAKDSLGSTSPAANLSITIVNPLTITTSSLPNGVVSVPYSQNLAATGGTTPYTWTLATGSLPAGLTLSSSGAIGGTPTTAGSPSFTVTVKDSGGLTAGPQSLTITINPALSITTTLLPNGAVNAAYSAPLAATGGVPPYSNWTVSSGSLPSGLTLNSSTGVIGGTPTATGSPSFSVTVKDSAGNTSTPANLSITIVSGLTITTTSLPNGTVGIAYNQTLQAAGGTPPYSNWTVSVGSLPNGLTLNSSSGAITGTPATAAKSTFSVTVQDSASTTSPAQQLSITIVNPVTITTSSLPGGSVGASYSQGLAAIGGTPPYSNWTVSSGSLPGGLSLNSSSGVIGGTPNATGAFPFSVTVKDSNGVASQPASLSIAIVGSLTITTTTLPNGTVGSPYSQTLAAAGGTQPYTWTLSGSLPAGLTLNSASGLINGTPTTVGSPSFSVTVKDGNGLTAGPQNLSITISSALTITTTSLPNGTVNVAYSATLAATGGAPPYNWTVTTGSLPAGLTLNSSTGVIGGTPTASGTTSFSVTVKDSAGNTLAQPLSITIAATPLTITTNSLPGGAVGVAYSQALAVSGGTPPYSNWTVSSGSLPAGLSLNSSSGVIAGTPTTAGPSSFSVTVKDSAGGTSPAKALSIAIAAPLSITTASLPSGVLGVAYSQTLAATGGTPPYSNWTVTSGSLPPGLTLNAATGAIGGTPTTVTGSPFTFSVTVGDSANSTSPPKSLSLAIGAAQLKIGSPSNYFFTLANTAAPAAGTLTVVASDGSALPFTVTAAPANFNWLTFTPTSGVTPATIKLTANPAGLIPGIYVTPLIVKSGSLSLTVPAQLTITGSNLAASPNMLTFNYQPALPFPAPQTISLTTITGGSVALASVTTDAGWLSVTPASSAPAMLQVSVNPGLLAVGTYSGDVLVKGVGSPNTSLDIPVTLTVGAAPRLTATPASLAFNYQIGGAAPAPQSFAVAATGGVPVNFTATSPGIWLQLSPQTGTTPGSVLVTANPAGLAAGTYGGTINVTSPGAANSAPVAVTLTVTGVPQLSIGPSQLTFAAPVGGPTPAPQTLTVTSANGPLAFTAAAGSVWLGVTPTSGTTPAALSVSVNATGLANGTYNGTINITPAGSALPELVLVTLHVGSTGPGITTPTIVGVINAASGAAGTVAPGMAVSIFGSALGPQTGIPWTAPPLDGTAATTLGGTQVLFDGTPVPLLYSANGQVNALAPFELAGKASTVLTVSYNGQTSAGMVLPVVAGEPGLFTADATGKGQGAILDQNFDVNGASNPAAAGSAIMLFGTGGGVTVPPSTDGTYNPISTTGALALTTTATIGGQPATVLYAGPAPGLIAGIFQINLTIPSGTPSGNAAVIVTLACPAASPANCSTASSQTVTVAVQ